MSARYLVISGDEFGVASETICDNFDNAVSLVRLLTNMYPSRRVGVIDRRVGIGRGDGLSDAQRDAVFAARGAL